MTQLVVLNSVIENLLGEHYQHLVEILRGREFTVTDSKPGIAEVRSKYADWLEKTDKFPVIDSRCPAIRVMVRDEFPKLQHLLAPIDPILITGAGIRQQEIGATELLVITPCQAFTSFEEPNRRMITWKEFKEQQGITLPETRPETSPVLLSSSAHSTCRPLAQAESKLAKIC